MKIRIFKLLILIVIFIFLYLLIKFVIQLSFYNNFPAVIFFDVGQGDSILLRNINGKNILIDGGPDNTVINRLGYYLPHNVREIDIVIVSHYHADHIVGLIEVINRYKVKYLILMDDEKTSAVYEYLKWLASVNVETIYLKNELEIDLGHCLLRIINPYILQIRDNNNNSLIKKLICQNNSFLFLGDNELDVEKRLLDSGIDISADVFKASHHGSRTSNSKELIDRIDPRYFVVSVGENNRHNHPSLEVLNYVSELGIIIKRTDLGASHVFAIDTLY